jgi:ribosomal protein S1
MEKGRTTHIKGNVITGVVHSGDISYTIAVNCDDRPLTMRAAFEFAAIKCNTQARAGKLHNGETYTVNPWGDVYKTPSQVVAEMSPEQKAQLRAALDAELKAEKEAAKAAAKAAA